MAFLARRARERCGDTPGSGHEPEVIRGGEDDLRRADVGLARERSEHGSKPSLSGTPDPGRDDCGAEQARLNVHARFSHGKDLAKKPDQC